MMNSLISHDFILSSMLKVLYMSFWGLFQNHLKIPGIQKKVLHRFKATYIKVAGNEHLFLQRKPLGSDFQIFDSKGDF